MRLALLAPLALGMLTIAAEAAAEPGFADLDALDRQVSAFTGMPTGESGGALTPLDRRLRLQPCRSGVALSWRSVQHESVVIQCGDVGGWRLFVPVRQSQAAASAVAVRRGDGVAIAVMGDGFTVSQPGEALESGAVGGWIAVRPVSAGLCKGDVMHAQIVRPGLVSVPIP